MDTGENSHCVDQCEDAQQMLCELFDAETTEQRAAEIRSFLSSCPQCFSRFESELAVRGLVRQCCGQAQAPEPLRQRIISSITSVTITQIRYRT